MNPDSHRDRGPRFWVTAAAGWALILWGVRGALLHRVETHPPELVRYLLGGALVHDLVVAPLVLLIGLGLARAVPARWRSYVQVGAVITACLALFSYPLVRGFGHVHRNPTSLPYNYAANLAIVLGVVWLTIAVVAVVATAKARRRRSPVSAGPTLDTGR